MKRLMVIAVLGAALLGLVSLATAEPVEQQAAGEPAVSEAPTPPPTTTAAPTVAVSYEPIVFVVADGKTTATFPIPTSIVTIAITNDGGSCEFAAGSVTLYAANGDLADFPFSVDGCASGETEVHLDGPGDYYVRIGTANTTTTVTITPHD